MKIRHTEKFCTLAFYIMKLIANPRTPDSQQTAMSISVRDESPTRFLLVTTPLL